MRVGEGPEVLEGGPEGAGCLLDVMAVFPLLGSLWGLEGFEQYF